MQIKNEITYADIMNVMRCGNKLTCAQKNILVSIMDYDILKSKGKMKIITLTKLTQDVGMTVTNVRLNAEMLEKMGLITKFKNTAWHNTNDYIANIEAIRELVEDNNNNEGEEN